MRARGMDELYDLENDPDERRNLIRFYRNPGKHKEVVSRLNGLLESWMRSIGDPALRGGG